MSNTSMALPAHNNELVKLGLTFKNFSRVPNFSLFDVNEPLVEHELFLLSHRNLLIHSVGQILLSSVVAAGSWSNISHEAVFRWMACVAFSTIALFAGSAAFLGRSHAPPNSKTLREWRLAHVLMLATVGMTWGSAGFLFAPQAHDQNLMVMIAFSGVFAYSAATNAPQDPLAFGVSAVIGTMILMSQIPAAFGSHAVFILSMCILYFISLTVANRNARKTLLASIKLRLANELLAKEKTQSAQRAEQANRDKSEFLAAASHDLRQPVHALLLLIEAYRQQVPAANAHPLVGHISEAAQAIRNLINALMELSRLDSGSEQVCISSVNLPEILRRLQRRIQPEAQRKGVSLKCFESKALAGLSANTDGILLERVIGNLLSNAVRYTEEGGVLLSLRKAHGNLGVWIEVWDTGIGIAASEHERIFNPYVQVGNLERDRSKGLGLGLAIVRQSVAVLGMQLNLASQPGRGSCFRLLLPRAVCEFEGAPAIPRPKALAFARPPMAGRRILLVEDDPMALRAMQALLSEWQVDLRCAGRGDSTVLDVCSSGWAPECVLCDFRLPGPLDGIEVLGLVLDQHPDAVGILQTGELAKRVLAQAEDAGYLVMFKPIDAAILAATLTAVFDKRPTAGVLA